MAYEFKLPDVGEGLHEGRILEFKVEPGARIEEGEIIAIVETDKVVTGISSPKTGVLHKFGAEQGETIKVGETLAYIQVDSSRDSGPPSIVGTLDADPNFVLPASDEGVAELAPDRSTSKTNPSSTNQTLATPATRRLARELGVDLRSVSGSGPAGRIDATDVVEGARNTEERGGEKTLPLEEQRPTGFAFPLIDDPLATPSDHPIGQTVELTMLRKTIAHNMELSRKIPTAIVHDSGVVDALVELRDKVNDGHGIRVSFQPFFMKALATALRRYPVLNASFDPVSEEVTIYGKINIGFAVNTEAGLLLPVIRNVESKTIREIDAEMKDHVEAAKNRQIDLGDLRGGTFSLTNFGPFGGLYASPMIFPPQVAIVGIGRIHQAPVVTSGKIVPAQMLPVSLAFDHRVVDGVPAASFISYFLELLYSPQELFVSM